MFKIDLKEIGLKSDIILSGCSSITSPKDNSVIFCLNIDEYIDNLMNIKNSLIIINEDYKSSKVGGLSNFNYLIKTEYPKFEYSKILKLILNKSNYYSLFDNLDKVGNNFISNNNVKISSKVKLGTNISIGPNVRIGDNTEICDGVKIVGNVDIGKNCVIGYNSVIGYGGFGYAKSRAEMIKMPHLGGVIIGDDVDIGCLTTVVSGAIDPTVIGNRTKIDDHVHVGHNVLIGEDCIITACAELCRSNIKNNVWIGPNSSVIQGASLEEGCYVGIGSVVTKDVNEKEIVAGNPASNIEMFKKIRKFLKQSVQ